MRAAFLAALLCAAANAQGSVCLTGEVVPVGGPTICMQGETHRIQHTRVFLKSSVLDLNRFNGMVVRISGRGIGVTCTVIDVVDVQLPRAVLTRCGSPSPGCPIKLKLCPGGLGRWWLWGSFSGPGYLPIGCVPPDFIDGTVLLGLPAITIVHGTVIGLCGEYILRIPNDPSLVGVRAWFQAARQDIGPVGPITISNVEFLQLAPFMPPCAPINC